MAVGDTHVFPSFLTSELTQISLQSHRLLFSHASAEMRGENTSERNFASTGSRTHNHKVMSPTRSPLSHQGRMKLCQNVCLDDTSDKLENGLPSNKTNLPDQNFVYTLRGNILFPVLSFAPPGWLIGERV